MNDRSGQLLLQVLEACGFSTFTGRGAIQRSLEKHGATIETATPDDYRAALDEIRQRLEVYTKPEEAARRIARVVEVLDRAARTPSAVRPAEFGDDDETVWGKRRSRESVEILRDVRKKMRDITGD